MADKRTITVTVGGVGFVAAIDYDSASDWYIDEIYPDTSDWGYKNGLYDYLNKWTIEAVECEVQRELNRG